MTAPEKNREAPIPIPVAWRSTLSGIVGRLARREYSLQGIPSVDVADGVHTQIEQYVSDYGETLVELPEESWSTSAAQWTDGYWDALIDLWTAESGKSDLVLSVRVFERGNDYRFEIHGVYVP